MLDFLFDLPWCCVLILCSSLVNFQQKLAKREVGTIDRSQDIILLQEFYRLYREKNNVDKLKEEEKQLRESGAFTDEYVLFPLFSDTLVSKINNHFTQSVNFMLWLLLLNA